MSATKRRQFSREFKLQVLAEIEAGKPIAQAACEHHSELLRKSLEVHPNTLSAWREQHRLYGAEAFAGNTVTALP